MRKYQPSNGTEGMIFMEEYCEQCIHERWCHFQDENKEEDKCQILSNTMIYDVRDEEYPEEWTYDENDNPICTKWQKWDWGNDNDGWNEPPEPPYEPQDPNQLMMFSIADDILQNHKVKETVKQ